MSTIVTTLSFVAAFFLIVGFTGWYWYVVGKRDGIAEQVCLNSYWRDESRKWLDKYEAAFEKLNKIRDIMEP